VWVHIHTEYPENVGGKTIRRGPKSGDRVEQLQQQTKPADGHYCEKKFVLTAM
jgi:dihydroxyacetone kinase-like predicted kinase